MTRPSFLVATVLLASFVLLAACGGDNPATPTPILTTTSAQPTISVAGEFNVCSLLTADEAGAATGNVVAKGAENSDATSFFCEWTGSNSNVSIEVITGTTQDRETFYQQHDVGAPITELGTRAQFTTVSGVDVLTDNYYVGVTVLSFGFTDDQRKQQSRNLAELVLTRLPNNPPALPTAAPAAATTTA